MKAAVCLLAVLALFLGGILMLRVWESGHLTARQAAAGDAGNKDGDQTDSREQDLTYYKDGWYAPKKDLETVLILGIDKYAENQEQPGNGSYEQADFLLLAVLDPKAGTCAAIHLNRDTMTEIQVLSDKGAVADTKIAQITLSHAYGGTGEIRCKNTVTAVSNLLYGVEIDHYISMTMDGVGILNDLAGGITLDVLDDFTGIDDELVKGQRVTLKGSQALAYVRTRQSLEDSSNLNRMKRQRQYLEALQEQLFEKMDEDEGFLFSALLQVNPYLVSDCSVEQISDLVRTVKACQEREYLTLDGEARRGDVHMEYYVDDEALQEMVMGRFFEKVE